MKAQTLSIRSLILNWGDNTQEATMKAQRTVVTIVLIGVTFAGCASTSSQLPSVPVRGQTQAERERDAAQCSTFAAEDTEGHDERDARFAACMLARGYRETVSVRVGLEHGQVDLEARGKPPVTQVANDLRECASRLEASGGRASSKEIFASRIGGAFSASGSDQGHVIRSEALERDFSACFTDRGYISAPFGGSR
jgi:hypothetical protein